MGNHPVISIITPSYNQDSFLPQTIESIIGQEGDFYLDYIIIDGASRDSSVTIIKHYAKLLEEKIWDIKCNGINYRWLSEKDRGQAHALMKGFSLAEGEIFAWLNSDDLYLPGTLQTTAVFFQENLSNSFLYGDAHYCDTEGKIVGRYPAEEFDLEKLAYFNFICQPSTFFRRKAFEDVGGLDESLHFTLDYDLFIKIGKRFRCCYMPQVFSKYRLHGTSKTVRSDDLLEYHEEILYLTLKHFNWAPLNQVYGFCYYYCLSRLPVFLKKFRFLMIGSALFCAILRSLWLNHGLHRKDLKLLKLTNLRKIFKERMEILHG